jgi:hypothetical protein
LLLLVKDTPVDVLSQTLNSQGGRLYKTSFSPEAAAAFTQAGNSPEVMALGSQES